MKSRAPRIAVIVAVAAAGVAAAGGMAVAHDHHGHHKFVSDQDYNADESSGDDAGLGIVQGLLGVH